MAKQYPRIIALVSLLALLVALVPAAGISAQPVTGPPIVDGLFYGVDPDIGGTPDYEKYVFLAQNPGRGTLYYYVDESTNILYVAVVVLPTVNDNVFGISKNGEPDYAYVRSAEWNRHHTALDLIQSDNVGLNLTCDGTSYTWEQDYVYVGAGTGPSYRSDALGPDGSGTPPPSLVSASSLQWMLNNWFDDGQGWDPTLGDSTLDSSPELWLSVNTGDLDTIVDEIGWTTNLSDTVNPPQGWWDDVNQWEWTMVYEMSIDLDVACGGAFPSPIVQSAHNSPAKSGAEDVPFAFYDLGDAPEGEMINAGTSYAVMANYGTALANNGPKHLIIADPATGQITSPILGLVVDAEGDGQPGLPAADDDLRPWLIPGFGNDDEDGLVMPLPELEAGELYTLVISGTAGAHLDGWIDLNLDGDFDEGTAPALGAIPLSDRIADTTLIGAPQDITFRVPNSFPSGTGAPDVVTYGRFRVNTDQGRLPPTEALVVVDPNLGIIAAADGEVEDYVFSNFVPTAIDLANFGAQAQGEAIEIAWETTDEIDNLGFNLYRAASKAGARVKLNDGLIPSQVAPGSPVGASYSWLDED
ncbi:MAG: GEVED domain-containing protein, partial [Anaerolineae bacterium]